MPASSPMASVPAAPVSRLQEYLQLVKFEHTVFALPFALSAMLLACAPGAWPPVMTVVWIVLAMVGGRTYAMAINRLLDARFDAANPRTRGRGIPAGRVKPVEAWLLVAGAGLLFTLATMQLPPLCLQLLPLAFVILTVYSLMKRFSSLAHLVLGVALGSSAVGGWLAVTGAWSNLAVVFGLAVTCWVSGFDVIYACQDVRIDRRLGLNSLPANLGIARALWLSRIFHALTVLLLVAFGLAYPHTGGFYGLAVALTAGMLLYEHWLIRSDDPAVPIRLEKVNEAFFTTNGRISLAVFVCILLDRLLL
ncbi:MAG: UbiA-like polyprenyltransferase [Candidatus Melainabacteria bacterium]